MTHLTGRVVIFDAHPAGGIMETGVRIMWPPVRAEVVRTGKDTLPLYTQPQAGCQPMRQVVAASGKQRVGAMLRGRTASHLPGRWAAQVLTSHRSSPRNERKKNAGQALGGSIFGDSFRRLRGKRRSAMRGSAYRNHTIHAFKEPYMWHIHIILARCNVRTLQICPKCVPEILHLL